MTQCLAILQLPQENIATVHQDDFCGLQKGHTINGDYYDKLIGFFAIASTRPNTQENWQKGFVSKKRLQHMSPWFQWLLCNWLWTGTHPPKKKKKKPIFLIWSYLVSVPTWTMCSSKKFGFNFLLLSKFCDLVSVGA